MSEWLENLKVGDQVVVMSGGGYMSRDYVSTVKRLTKTLIVTENDRGFRRSDGRSPGGIYHDFLEEPTLQRLGQIKQIWLATKLKAFSWKLLPLETLEAINNLLPKNLPQLHLQGTDQE